MAEIHKSQIFGGTWRSALFCLIFLFFWTTPLNAGDVNIVNKISAVASGVEIELHSTRPFPVRNEIVILRIGNEEFTKSRYADDGDLKTLIFTLTPTEYARINTGDKVTVYYGRNASTENKWDFGAMDKIQIK